MQDSNGYQASHSNQLDETDLVPRWILVRNMVEIMDIMRSSDDHSPVPQVHKSKGV